MGQRVRKLNDKAKITKKEGNCPIEDEKLILIQR